MLSYPVYMCHVLIIGMASNVTHALGMFGGWLLTTFVIVIVILFSAALYVFVERPIDAF